MRRIKSVAKNYLVRLAFLFMLYLSSRSNVYAAGIGIEDLKNYYLEITLAVSLVFLALIIYIGVKLYVSRKYNTKNWKKYVIQEGDDIQSLSSTYNIDQKILIRSNNIKDPAKLVVGDEILVPPLDEGNESEDMSDSISDKADEKGGPNFVGGTSIAETLWEDYERKGKKIDVDSLTVDKKIDNSQVGEKKEKVKKKEETGLVHSKEISSKKPTVDISSVEVEAPKEVLPEKNHDKKERLLSVIVYGAVLVAVATIAFFVGRFSAKKEAVIEEEFTVTEEPSVQQEVVTDMVEKDSGISQEEELKVDFSNSSILVLNGGTQAGVAGKLKSVIVSADESVENIKSQNAIGNYKGETIIYYQEEFKTEAERLQEILEEKYGELKLVSSQELPENEKKDNVVIVIGEES